METSTPTTSRRKTALIIMDDSPIQTVGDTQMTEMSVEKDAVLDVGELTDDEVGAVGVRKQAGMSGDVDVMLITPPKAITSAENDSKMFKGAANLSDAATNSGFKPKNVGDDILKAVTVDELRENTFCGKYSPKGENKNGLSNDLNMLSLSPWTPTDSVDLPLHTSTAGVD